VREQQKKFDTAQWYDYVVAFIVAAVGSGITSVLVFFASQFFFGILVLFLAPGAGVVIGNIILRFIRKRRSRALFLTSAVGIVVGAVPALLLFALPILLALIYGSLGAGLGAILPAIWEVVYLFMAVPAAYTQISGIRIGG
jgi:hypothetical protein